MADRQDIDALLVGALYGELSSADHQRLEAHLASHPQDRAALDAMTHTRGRLREGLAATPDAEPPAALSALLLQEAARRAPARKPAGAGLWAWLEGAMRSMAAHPAMAAAAAFVLIAGVAGSFVLTGRQPTYEASAPSTVATAPTAPPAPAGAAADDPSYQAGLAEPRPGEPAVAAVPAPTTPDTRDTRVALRERRDEAAGPKDEAGKNAADDRLSAVALVKKPAAEEKKELEAVLADLDAESGAKGAAGADKLARAQRRYVPVTTTEPSLKEDDDAAADGYARAPAPASPKAPAPASASRTESAAAPAAPPPESVAGGRASGAVAPYDPSREQARDAWASAMHQKVVLAVKRRDCAAAATVAAEISIRAGDYYVKRVSGDKAILPCKAQIDRERKKEAERRSRAPAKDSVNAEPAPAATRN